MATQFFDAFAFLHCETNRGLSDLTDNNKTSVLLVNARRFTAGPCVIPFLYLLFILGCKIPLSFSMKITFITFKTKCNAGTMTSLHP